jgi:biopolymer transport protein ExbB/TolQ
MKHLITHTILSSILVPLAIAAESDTLTESKNRIEKAAQELSKTVAQNSDLRRFTYNEINKLDDEVIALTKELRALERDEEMRTIKTKTLDKEVDQRKAQFTYASGLLNQYSKAFISRIHPAEYQQYKQNVANIDQSALNAVNEPVKEINERVQVLSIGIKRLAELAGGYTFAGKAFGFAGKSIEGNFLIMGTSVYFAAQDKISEGICPMSDTGSGYPAFVSINQSGGAIAKVISSGTGVLPVDGTMGKAITAEMKHPGGQNKALEHVMLFGDIAKNMMFDGWIAIAICIAMIGVGWTVAARKILYLNKIEKGNHDFMREWRKMANDLTTLDRNADAQKLTETPAMKRSPFYEIYHIGAEEITARVSSVRSGHKGLSGRSIQAVRAALDAGLVNLQHKLTNGLVYLTISIAGGPYVGLLGTVVGVMITFAIISKEGEVNVNAIAPGIASALLATVAGLIVAIPALFAYSYLNNRIKNITSEVKVFIDEFVSKMAEYYPQVNEAAAPKFSDGEED